MTEKDTICAPSTAHGRGAIHVIRVSGEDALRITSKIFSKDLTDVTSHTAHFGTIKDESGTMIDEVIVTIFQKGKSYTGEHTAEISCHGSSFIKQEIIRLLLKNDCRMANPGEFTMRAYFNGNLDLSQAEAVADLIAADSQKAHNVALQQMRGGYSEKIRSLRDRLMNFASLIELELDFSEEDVEFASRKELKKLVIEIQEQLSLLTSSFAYGNALKNGVNVVIAGRPNAGKSTLLNAFIEDERAIVSNIPGTTRDTIEEKMIIDGVLYNFIDTAGIREATDEIEKMGIERTYSMVEKSNILLYVFDILEMTETEVLSDLEKIKHTQLSILVLANKSEEETRDLSFISSPYPIFPISAKNHLGLEKVKAELSKIVADLSNESDTIVVNARHYEAFSRALEDMNRVSEAIETEVPSDLIAMDIRSAIRHLASITGDISTDDLLGNIFANFCIGK